MKRQMIKFNKFRNCTSDFIQLSKHEVKWLGGIGLFYFVFKGPIEFHFSRFIVKPILSLIQESWPTDVGVVILSIGTIAYAIWFKIKYNRRPWAMFSVMVFSVSIFYLIFYRFNPGFHFYSFSVLSSFYYLDLLIISFSVSRVILHIPWYNTARGKSQFELPLIEDNPLGIGKAIKDKLGYKKYAQSLVRRMFATEHKKSFAIGINGKWGSGKTTFMHLVKEELDDDSIVIEINPWQSSSPDAIIRDFFTTFREKLRPYHASLPGDIRKYSSKLQVHSKGNFSWFFDFVLSSVVRDESVKSLYDEINGAINHIDKRIIVFIDDLDRMDSEEVFAVIKLIRNSASFDKLIFLVAYDREYLVSSLKDRKLLNARTYLEKIFQLEINLPYFDAHFIRHALAEKLKITCDSKIHEEIDEVVLGTGYNTSVPLTEWVGNYRDAVRLANSVGMNIKGIEKDVRFKDFLLLEMLRVKYPSVYELLKNTHSTYFSIEKNHFGDELQCYTEPEEMQNQGLRAFNSNAFRNHISLKKDLSKDSIALSPSEQSRIIDLVRILFPAKNHTGTNLHSIAYPNNYERYFRYGLGINEISVSDFSAALNSDQEFFNDKISSWVGSGKTIDLKRKFEKMIFENKTDFEKVIRGIFYFATINEGKDNIPTNFVGFSSNVLFKKFVAGYNFYLGNDDFNEFALSVFHDVPKPYYFGSKQASEFYKQYLIQKPQNFPLTIQELIDISVMYLEKYTGDITNCDKMLFWLFYSCRLYERQSDGSMIQIREAGISPNAKEVIREFVESSDWVGFLEHLININIRDEEQYYLKTGDDIYNDWNDFEKIMEAKFESDSGSEELIEFKSFYEKVKENKFQSVEFDFKALNPVWV